jgi:hypothetical protein
MQAASNRVQLTEYDNKWLLEVFTNDVRVLDVPFMKDKCRVSVPLDRAIKIRAAIQYGPHGKNYILTASTLEQGVLDLDNHAELIQFKLACA